MNPYYSLLLTAVLLLVWGILTLNALIRARALVDDARSKLNLLLKHRFDLIPSTAAAMKEYISDEALERLIQVRNAAVYTSPFDIPAQAQASAAMSQALQKIMDVAVPDVKESLAALKEVEEDLQVGYNVYNTAVQLYNAQCTFFPSKLIAGAFHFTPKAYFESIVSNKDTQVTAP